MPKVIFTDNLKRHIHCPAEQVEADTVRQAIEQVFKQNPTLKSYILDDQNRLRKHMLIALNGQLQQDTTALDKNVLKDDEIYVLQALSGG